MWFHVKSCIQKYTSGAGTDKNVSVLTFTFPVRLVLPKLPHAVYDTVDHMFSMLPHTASCASSGTVRYGSTTWISAWYPQLLFMSEMFGCENILCLLRIAFRMKGFSHSAYVIIVCKIWLECVSSCLCVRRWSPTWLPKVPVSPERVVAHHHTSL